MRDVAAERAAVEAGEALPSANAHPTALSRPKSRTQPGTWSGKGLSSMEALAAAANLPDGLSEEHQEHIKTQLLGQFGAHRMDELIPHMVRALSDEHRAAWRSASAGAKAPLYGGVENFEEIQRIAGTANHPARGLAQHLVGQMSAVAQQAAQPVLLERSSRSIAAKQKSARTRGQGTQGITVDAEGNPIGKTSAGVLPGTDVFGNPSKKAVLRATAAQVLHQDILENPNHPTSQKLLQATGTTLDTIGPQHLEHYLGDLSKNTGHLGRQVSEARLTAWGQSGARLDNHPTGTSWDDAVAKVQSSIARQAVGKSDLRPETLETDMSGSAVGSQEARLRAKPAGALPKGETTAAKSMAQKLSESISDLTSTTVRPNSEHIASRVEEDPGVESIRQSALSAAQGAEASMSRTAHRRHDADATHLSNLLVRQEGPVNEARGPEFSINQDSLAVAQRIAGDPTHKYHHEAKKRLAALDQFRQLSGNQLEGRTPEDVLQGNIQARTNQARNLRASEEAGRYDPGVPLNRDGGVLDDVVQAARTGAPMTSASPVRTGGSTQVIEAADPSAAEDAVRSLGGLVTPEGRETQKEAAKARKRRRAARRSGGTERKTVTGRNTSSRR